MTDKIKRLNRWLNQLERILNDGTRDYPVLDRLINEASLHTALIKQNLQQQKAIDKHDSEVVLRRNLRRHVLVIPGRDSS